MSKKPRKASVWYKMPPHFFEFVSEEKKIVHAEFCDPDSVSKIRSTATQSKIPTRQRLLAPCK